MSDTVGPRAGLQPSLRLAMIRFVLPSVVPQLLLFLLLAEPEQATRLQASSQHKRCSASLLLPAFTCFLRLAEPTQATTLQERTSTNQQLNSSCCVALQQLSLFLLLARVRKQQPDFKASVSLSQVAALPHTTGKQPAQTCSPSLLLPGSLQLQLLRLQLCFKPGR